MIFGLSEKTIHLIQEVFAQFPNVEQVIIYGSRAKGNNKPGSDIDLTLIGNELSDQEITTMMRLIDELPIPYTVDLSLLHHIDNPDLIAHIQRVGKVFYTRFLSKC